VDKETIILALRRRWWIVVLLAAVGLLLGALPNPTTTADAPDRNVTYKANHTLLVSDPTGTDLFQNQTTFNQLELFATVGEVPARAAKRLGYDGEPAQLASELTVELNAQTGAIRIGTEQATAQRAVDIADAFAEELTTYLAERQDALTEQRSVAVQKRLDDLQKQVRDLQSKLALNQNDEVVRAELDAISRRYSAAYEQQSSLGDTQALIVLTTLESAQPVKVASSAGRGLVAPRSRLSRGVLGGLLGGLLGAALALVLARADRRIRTRSQAEQIYGLRANVTIPVAPNDQARGIVVSPTRHDGLSDAYRTLRSVLGFVEGGAAKDEGRAPIVLVVSASPGDGKTSVTANLAAAFVETGSRTIAVNTDFRRPTLSTRILGSKPQPMGFSAAELASLPPRFLLNRTPVPGLALMDLAGVPGGTHGGLARTTAQFLPRLAKLADAIVVDSSPIGATAEVLELVPLADVIVVVTRLGNTSISTAERTIEVLRSLTTADMLLAVVGDASDKGNYYYYYEYGSYGADYNRTRRTPRSKRWLESLRGEKTGAAGMASESNGPTTRRRRSQRNDAAVPGSSHGIEEFTENEPSDLAASVLVDEVPEAVDGDADAGPVLFDIASDDQLADDPRDDDRDDPRDDPSD